jgi:predicted DNA-binding transcriptional regulator AlpA
MGQQVIEPRIAAIISDDVEAPASRARPLGDDSFGWPAAEIDDRIRDDLAAERSDPGVRVPA